MTEQRPEEWGERRRRREDERQRQLAAEREAAVAPTPDAPVVADPPDRPLSRRELRERAAAAEARAAAESAPAAPVPPTTPAERPRSRRELRAATSETSVVPAVVPPALTGGIRRVSADGSLGEVELTPPEILSAQARADALRAQAARVQVEREDAARRGVERSQAQRAATQRADAERSARERTQRLAEQLAQHQDAATALPVEPAGPAVGSLPIVTLAPDDEPRPVERAAPAPWTVPALTEPAAARPAVPSASEAEHQASERADDLARTRAAEIARDRAELIESERRAHESALRAERERATDRRPVEDRPSVSAAMPEEPLHTPQWASVPRPDTGPTPTPTDSGSVPVPRWSAVRHSTGPQQVSPDPVAEAPSVPSTSTWSPAGAEPVAAQAWPTAVGSGPAPAAPLPEPVAALDPDEPADDGPPARVYTWFHIAALAVVAFVLGLLIVMVLLKDNNQPTSSTSQAVEVTVPGPQALGVVLLRPTGI